MKAFKDLKRLVAHTFRAYPKRSALCVFLLTMAAIFEAVGVMALLPIIEYLNETPLEQSNRFVLLLNNFLAEVGISRGLVTYFSIAGAIIAVKACFKYFSKYYVLRMRMDFQKSLQRDAIDGLLYASGRYLESKKSGDISNIISKEVEDVGSCLFYIYSYSASILRFISYFVVLLSFSFGLVLVVGLTAVVSAVPSILLNKHVYRLAKQKVSGANRLLGNILEVIENMYLFKSYNAEETVFKKFKHKSHEFQDLSRRVVTLREFTASLIEPMAVIQISIIVYVSLYVFGLNFPTF